MNANRKKFRTRSWFGEVNSHMDLNYIKSLKYKYLCISRRGENGWRVLLQFKDPREKPGTRNTFWLKSRTIKDSIELINALGDPIFKDGQLDVWTVRKSDLHFIRTNTGAKYWKE